MTVQSLQDVVSVVIPSYNRQWSLPRAVSSVLDQTDRAIECIVADDGSTDETVQWLTSRQEQDPRLRFICSSHRGSNAARNAGAAVATGKWVAFLDSDDELDSQWLEILRPLLAKHDIVSCGYRELREDRPPVIKLPINRGPALDNVVACWMAGCYILPLELHRRAGGHDEETPSWQQRDYMFRILDACGENIPKFGYTEQALVSVYVSNTGNIRSNPEKFMRGAIRLLERHADRIKRDDVMCEQLLRVISVNARRAGHRRIALQNLLRLIAKYPTSSWAWKRLPLYLVPTNFRSRTL